MHPFVFVLIIALPFYIIRVGGYVMWKISEQDLEKRKTWWTFNQTKPGPFWVDSLVFWSLQLAWGLACMFPAVLLAS